MDTTRITLIQKLKNPENQHAWEDFYRLYAGPILRFAQKKGLDDATSKDVLQETMIVLMGLIQRFEYDPAVGKFRNFLLTLTLRLILKHTRRAYKTREVSMNSQLTEEGLNLEELLAAPQTNSLFEEADLSAWLSGILDNAIQALRQAGSAKPKHIDIFVAIKRNDEDPVVVADQFGMTRNAVDQAVFRVKKQLAILLSENYGIVNVNDLV